MPAGAIYVGRPTRWGNPFVVGSEIQISGTAEGDTGHFGERREVAFDISGLVLTPAIAVALYREDLRWALMHLPDDQAGDRERIDENRAALAELAGHDLVCWCGLDQPCHADVLLEMANQ